MKHIPITKALKELLLELGYSDNIGSDKYIIGTDDKTILKMKIEIVSKAFTHY